MIIVSDEANLVNYTGPGHVLNDEIDRRKARAACQDRVTLRGLKKIFKPASNTSDDHRFYSSPYQRFSHRLSL